MIEAELAGWLADGLRAGRPGPRAEPRPPTPELHAPRAEGARRLRDERRARAGRRVGRPPREVAAGHRRRARRRRRSSRRSRSPGPGSSTCSTTDDWLHDVVRADRWPRGRRYGRSRAHGRARAGRVREREPDRAAHDRPRAQRRDRRRARPAARRRRAMTVEREYYFNDAGGQMDRFGASVEARYLQAARPRRRRSPRTATTATTSREIAEDILATEGPALGRPPRRRAARPAARARARGARWTAIRATLARFGVAFDTYVSEASLEDEGEIDAGDRAAARGRRHLRGRRRASGSARPRSATTRTGSLVRSNGRHTYFAADCAYLIDKFRRGFDHLIYVWGADHHGDVVRVKGAAQALGLDPDARRAPALPVRLVPARRRAGEDEQARRARSSRSTS